MGLFALPFVAGAAAIIHCGDECNCKKRCNGWFEGPLKDRCRQICRTNSKLWSPEDVYDNIPPDQLLTNYGVDLQGDGFDICDLPEGQLDPRCDPDQRPASLVPWLIVGTVVIIGLIVALIAIKK